MDLNLQGKNALVCGSTAGIGNATANELALLGANVTLLARNEAKLKTSKEALDTSKGQVHKTLVADFSKPEELKAVITEHVAAGNAYHILINNTGGPPGGPIQAAELLAFRMAFNQHLICNHVLVQALLEGMKGHGYGRIINVISTSVKQPLNGLGVSNTIRGAVANWSKTLANELGGHGITVNNVLPGATNTERLNSIIESKAAKSGKSIAEVAKDMQSIVPAARFAEPNEVANAIAFLASPAAGYINGVNLPVDGGRTKSL